MLSVFTLGWNNGTHHMTSSYMHPSEVRAYPLNRPGHVRKSNEPMIRTGDPNSKMLTMKMMEHKEVMRMEARGKGLSPISRPFASDVKCNNNKAGAYACSNIDMLSFVPISELGSTREASDSWGWTDPQTKDEIAIILMEDSTAFVQVTDPYNPIVLGNLYQSGDRNRIWADAKVYDNHVYIIREVTHGLQIMDLTTLRPYYNTPSQHVRQLKEDNVYREFGSSHNVVINPETAFAYVVGSTTCSGGFHVVDIADPKNPTFAGCFGNDGYCHDAQVVMYDGPDARYKGREIAIMFNEDTLTIVDVSDKSNMKQLSRTSYDRNYYTHQGWFSPDMRFVIANDELDESRATTSADQYTRTLLWDVSNLEAPFLTGSHIADVKSIDHNLYTKNGLAYLSNYCSGLRVLSKAELDIGKAPEEGYFDTADYCDNEVIFQGAWSNFPYFDSGNVVVSNIETGMFMLKVNSKITGEKPAQVPVPIMGAAK
jgi:choice-of-anchor B domain-containing protein